MKSYIDRSNKSQTKAKIDFEKYFFQLLGNSFFEKTMENLRKHRDIILITTDKRTKLVRTKLSHNKMIFRNCIRN